MANKVLSGIMGLCVADALGVPVEFTSRELLMRNPVIGMRGYGTYDQPAGAWSDDTSMTLCLMDSLINGLNYEDIMSKFTLWADKAKYTPYDEVFDMGFATRKAISRFESGEDALSCGGQGEHDNGNGSLMRILPIAFFLHSIFGAKISQNPKAMDIIHNVSSLTHAHMRSKIACGIYVSVACMLNEGAELEASIEHGINSAFEYYEEQDGFAEELVHYERIRNIKEFANTSVAHIKSSGYVVDTLEAAVWCLLNTKSYRDCVLKAVNLGEDTDTVAAVAGGLAGLYYGYDAIPYEWLSVIAKRDYIEDLCNKFHMSLYAPSMKELIKFIPYFEKATRDSVCTWSGGERIGKNTFAMSYPIYEEKMHEFIQTFYKTNLVCYNYSQIVQEKGIYNNDDLGDAIETADLELLKAILTGYVRQERFCSGLWASAVEEKIFIRILYRLKELLEG